QRDRRVFHQSHDESSGKLTFDRNAAHLWVACYTPLHRREVHPDRHGRVDAHATDDPRRLCVHSAIDLDLSDVKIAELREKEWSPPRRRDEHRQRQHANRNPPPDIAQALEECSHAAHAAAANLSRSSRPVRVMSPAPSVSTTSPAPTFSASAAARSARAPCHVSAPPAASAASAMRFAL